MPSVSSLSLFHPAASCVRKYTDSIVIGSQQQTPAPTHTRQQQPQQNADADADVAIVPQDVSSSSTLPHPPRVVVCDFVMKIPTHALRIDMTILVSTNDRRRDPQVPHADMQPQPPQPPPRPSVTYKITICTPARRCRGLQQEQEHSHGPAGTAPAFASTPTASSMTTVTWSSKFTVAPDLAANRDPFYEWTGSFDLTTSRTAVPLDACSFYQVEGKFLANYDDDTTTAAAVPVPGTEDGSSWNRKSTSRPAREDTFGCGGDDDTSRVPRRKKPRRCFETNINNDESFLAQQPQQPPPPPPLLAGI